MLQVEDQCRTKVQQGNEFPPCQFDHVLAEGMMGRNLISVPWQFFIFDFLCGALRTVLNPSVSIWNGLAAKFSISSSQLPRILSLFVSGSHLNSPVLFVCLLTSDFSSRMLFTTFWSSVCVCPFVLYSFDHYVLIKMGLLVGKLKVHCFPSGRCFQSKGCFGHSGELDWRCSAFSESLWEFWQIWHWHATSSFPPTKENLVFEPGLPGRVS